MLDLLIQNVLIVDGTGTEPYSGSVGINGDKIAVINRDNFCHLPAEKIIDAGGLMLTPGFIDAHGHSDISILAAPEATGKISQGITTEICGNCGLSVFPVTSKNRTHLQELFNHYNVDIDWSTFAEYADRVTHAQPAINIASLCGHNTLRAAVAGYNKRELENCDIRKMEELLLSSIKEGASGTSTGLLYVPGRFAMAEELTELGKAVVKSGKIWTSHLRSEGKQLLEAIDEFTGTAAETGCRKIHISHLKTAGENNWQKLNDAFLRISQAVKSGIRVTADRYPYIESMTQLSAYMPSPYSEMDDVTLKHHLGKSANYAEFTAMLNKEYSDNDWKKKRLVSTDSQFISSDLFGKTFYEISEITKISTAEICANLLKNNSPGTMGASEGMSNDNMLKILQQPYVCCCTDESARPEDYSTGRSHPRGFGSFPEFIRRLSPFLKIEEIIAKMTLLPAGIFGIQQRGCIAEGYFADILLIDLKKLTSAESATFANPHKKAEGIEKVWVNGVMTCSNRNLTESRAGKILINHY